MAWSLSGNIRGATGASGAQGASGAPAARYTTLIGNGSDTAITITHNLAARPVHVSVYDASTWVEVECDVSLPSTNTATLTFATAPGTDAYSVTVT